MVHSVVLVLHVAVSLMIIGLVLLQRGKGAEAGTGFGAGASGTVFGARGSANFLSRATAVLATLFFALCLTLAYLSTQGTVQPSLLERTEQQRLSQPPELPILSPGDDATPPAGGGLTEVPEVPAPAGDGAAAPAGEPAAENPASERN